MLTDEELERRMKSMDRAELLRRARLTVELEIAEEDLFEAGWKLDEARAALEAAQRTADEASAAVLAARQRAEEVRAAILKAPLSDPGRNGTRQEVVAGGGWRVAPTPAQELTDAPVELEDAEVDARSAGDNLDLARGQLERAREILEESEKFAAEAEAAATATGRRAAEIRLSMARPAIPGGTPDPGRNGTDPEPAADKPEPKRKSRERPDARVAAPPTFEGQVLIDAARQVMAIPTREQAAAAQTVPATPDDWKAVAIAAALRDLETTVREIATTELEWYGVETLGDLSIELSNGAFTMASLLCEIVRPNADAVCAAFARAMPAALASWLAIADDEWDEESLEAAHADTPKSKGGDGPEPERANVPDWPMDKHQALRRALGKLPETVDWSVPMDDDGILQRLYGWPTERQSKPYYMPGTSWAIVGGVVPKFWVGHDAREGLWPLRGGIGGPELAKLVRKELKIPKPKAPAKPAPPAVESDDRDGLLLGALGWMGTGSRILDKADQCEHPIEIIPAEIILSDLRHSWQGVKPKQCLGYAVEGGAKPRFRVNGDPAGKWLEGAPLCDAIRRVLPAIKARRESAANGRPKLLPAGPPPVDTMPEAEAVPVHYAAPADAKSKADPRSVQRPPDGGWNPAAAIVAAGKIAHTPHPSEKQLATIAVCLDCKAMMRPIGARCSASGCESTTCVPVSEYAASLGLKTAKEVHAMSPAETAVPAAEPRAVGRITARAAKASFREPIVTEDQIDAVIKASTLANPGDTERWQEVKPGATDDEIREIIHAVWYSNLNHVPAKADLPQYTTRGDRYSPAIWVGKYKPRSTPTVAGQPLIDRIRRLLEIPKRVEYPDFVDFSEDGDPWDEESLLAAAKALGAQPWNGGEPLSAVIVCNRCDAARSRVKHPCPSCRCPEYRLGIKVAGRVAGAVARKEVASG